VYTRPIGDTEGGAGYQRTGFSFDVICRCLCVVEDHPAIMRYEAFKRWLARAYPVRGTRPAEAQAQLMRLSGHASRAKAAQGDEQRLAYNNRQSIRDMAWLTSRVREWTGEPPDMPVVKRPRGRSRTAIAGKVKRKVLRPARSWQAQVLDDRRILQELGHLVPQSTRPTQTWWHKRDDGRGAGMQAVPLEIAYHSWLSCDGTRASGTRCPHCIKDGKHLSKRGMTMGQLELPGDIP
jgi:hypothetical protein